MRVSNFQDDRAEGTAAVPFAGVPDACIIYHYCLILPLMSKLILIPVTAKFVSPAFALLRWREEKKMKIEMIVDKYSSTIAQIEGKNNEI